jgi:hypothetical protein
MYKNLCDFYLEHITPKHIERLIANSSNLPTKFWQFIVDEGMNILPLVHKRMKYSNTKFCFPDHILAKLWLDENNRPKLKDLVRWGVRLYVTEESQHSLQLHEWLDSCGYRSDFLHQYDNEYITHCALRCVKTVESVKRFFGLTTSWHYTDILEKILILLMKEYAYDSSTHHKLLVEFSYTYLMYWGGLCKSNQIVYETRLQTITKWIQYCDLYIKRYPDSFLHVPKMSTDIIDSYDFLIENDRLFYVLVREKKKQFASEQDKSFTCRTIKSACYYNEILSDEFLKKRKSVQYAFASTDVMMKNTELSEHDIECFINLCPNLKCIIAHQSSCIVYDLEKNCKLLYNVPHPKQTKSFENICTTQSEDYQIFSNKLVELFNNESVRNCILNSMDYKLYSTAMELWIKESPVERLLDDNVLSTIFRCNDEPISYFEGLKPIQGKTVSIELLDLNPSFRKAIDKLVRVGVKVNIKLNSPAFQETDVIKWIAESGVAMKMPMCSFSSDDELESKMCHLMELHNKEEDVMTLIHSLCNHNSCKSFFKCLIKSFTDKQLKNKMSKVVKCICKHKNLIVYLHEKYKAEISLTREVMKLFGFTDPRIDWQTIPLQNQQEQQPKYI